MNIECSLRNCIKAKGSGVSQQRHCYYKDIQRAVKLSCGVCYNKHIEESKHMAKVKTEYYVNNKEFLAAIVEYREQVAFAKKNDLPRPRLPRYIAECFLKIATHLSYKL